jgi:hypothetical protein
MMKAMLKTASGEPMCVLFLFLLLSFPSRLHLFLSPDAALIADARFSPSNSDEEEDGCVVC